MNHWRAVLFLLTLFCVCVAGNASAGEPRRVTAIELRGNRQIPSETILDFFKLTKVGDVYDKGKLNVDLDRARVELYGARGFLKARFNVSEVEDAGGGVKLVLAVEEDVPYRYGAIKVKDASLFSAAQMIETVGAKTGEVVKASDLKNGLERLHRAYQEQGYVRANINFEPEFKRPAADAFDGVVDVTLSVEEGVQYVIRSIAFKGTVESQARSLRRQLLIREGDLYRQSLIERSLLRMSRLNPDEPFRYEDVQMDTDERTHQVDLTFRLPEKRPQL